jgi:hypothetical protein
MTKHFLALLALLVLSLSTLAIACGTAPTVTGPPQAPQKPTSEQPPVRDPPPNPDTPPTSTGPIFTPPQAR